MKKTLMKYLSVVISVIFIISSMCVGVFGAGENEIKTTPFKDLTIPGRVNFCDFDDGGPNVSYGVIYSRNGTYNYRDGVYINFYESSFGAVVGTNVGGWYVYTLNVKQTGIYSIAVNCAALAKGMVKMTFDGKTEVTGEYEPSNSWTTPIKTTVAEVELTAGTHVMKFELTTGGTNLYNMIFDYEGEKSPYNFSKEIRPYRNFYIPTEISAEEYDIGGGISKDEKNNLKKFRIDEPMDIGKHDEHYNLFCENGESVEYTVNAEKNDTYSISADVCADSCISVEVDGVEVASMVETKYNEHTQYVKLANVKISEGKHKIKFLCEKASMSVNKFKIAITDEIPEENSQNQDEAKKEIYREMYVSADGNDMNTGDKNLPFKTVQRAVDEIKSINKEMNGDIVIPAMLADILLNRINCRIVALTAVNYKYAGQANLRYMSMNIVLTRRKSKNQRVQRGTPPFDLKFGL